MRHVIRLCDAPYYMRPGEIIDGHEFVVERPQYGRVLFIESVGLVIADGCTVMNCRFRT